MALVQTFGPLIGRILISLIFIMAGVGKIGDFNGTAHYISAKGMPIPEILTALVILIEVGGGLALALGLRARQAALLLIAFLAVISVILHNFWDMPSMLARTDQIMFMKNLAIMGGLLMIAAHGPGSMSVDKR